MNQRRAAAGDCRPAGDAERIADADEATRWEIVAQRGPICERAGHELVEGPALSLSKGVCVCARPLHQIYSVAPDGAITRHWQIADLEVARKMAAQLAARLEGREKVKLLAVIEVMVKVEQEIDYAFGRPVVSSSNQVVERRVTLDPGALAAFVEARSRRGPAALAGGGGNPAHGASR